MKRLTYCSFFLLAFWAPLAGAHLRWFTEESQGSATRFEFDYVYVLLVLLAACYCAFCVVSHRYSRKHQAMSRYLNDGLSFLGFEWDLLKASIALMFVMNLVNNLFLAPNLDVSVIGARLSFLIQITVVVCIATHNLLFALSLVLCLISTLFFFGLNLSIDYLPEFLGIALAFLAIELNRKRERRGSGDFSRHVSAIDPTSMLRWGIGLQLIVLSVHNKFLSPDMGLQFLANYPFVNFVNDLGLSAFKDIHFVFSAGLAELCFGILLMFHIASRFVSLCVIFFFSLTSVIFGVHELVGHIPIIAGLLVVALHGDKRGRPVSFPILMDIHKDTAAYKHLQSGQGRSHASL